jgi:hypothetical protein
VAIQAVDAQTHGAKSTALTLFAHHGKPFTTFVSLPTNVAATPFLLRLFQVDGFLLAINYFLVIARVGLLQWNGDCFYHGE